MKKSLSLLLIVCMAIGWVAAGGTGQFVSVEIEAFESWGILHWGAWESLPDDLLSMRVLQIPDREAARVADLQERCDSAPDLLGESEQACDVLARWLFQRESEFDIDPLLGRPYRIQLQNLTSSEIGVVVSVDGLNSNGNAEIAGNASDKKWILRPFQKVAISGWQVSSEEALRFEFAPPSQAHSSLEALRGLIQIAVYLPDPFAGDDVKGTQAGQMIDQPTVLIPFASATDLPVETLTFDYSRDRVILGVQCEETDGAGIQIAAVVEGTAADVAGLRAGDVITYANALPMARCADLQELLSTKSPGDRIILKVHRTDRVRLIVVELEE